MKIFYDMDNCLALFSRKGMEKIAVKDMYKKGYFRNLPTMENAVQTLAGLILEDYDIHILSACINSEYCKSEKLEWIEEYFPFIEKENIHLCKVGQNKAEVIGDVEGAILIDDYHKNLVEWEKAGGVAIKKRSSEKSGYKYVIKNHFEIFDILDKIKSES